VGKDTSILGSDESAATSSIEQSMAELLPPSQISTFSLGVSESALLQSQGGVERGSREAGAEEEVSPLPVQPVAAASANVVASTSSLVTVRDCRSRLLLLYSICAYRRWSIKSSLAG